MRVSIDSEKLDLLANVISDKSGEAVPMTLAEMTDAVDGIQTGGGEPVLQSKTYTVDSAGTETITADAGYDGLSEVEVSVPSASFWTGSVDRGFSTESGVRKWKIEARTIVDTPEGDVEGWLAEGDYSGTIKSFNAVPANTSVTPTESTQTIGGSRYMMEGAVTVNAIPSNYVGSGVARKSSSDLTASGATVTAPAGYYEQAGTKTVASGSATAPASISGTAATVSTGTNTLTLSKTVSVTPSVTAGYVASGTAGNSSVSLQANVTTKAAATIRPGTSQQTIASGTYLTGTQTISAVSQTNLTAENIKNGTTVTISNGQSNIFSVTGTYTGGGGGSVQTDTKTVTASNYPTSLSFTGMQGEPKMFTVRLNTAVSSSGSTTYYYIVDITSHGSASVHGNVFRIGSTRQVNNITSGYSWSYSGTTLTITSSAASRSASPGAFYSGSYELFYVY